LDQRKALFVRCKPYDVQKAAKLFLGAVKKNVALQQQNCPKYADILKHYAFSADDLNGEDDLYKIPVLPTLYYKKNDLFSIDPKKARINATSSGTSGTQSRVVFDKDTLYTGIRMMIRFFLHHKVISPIPTNYIVLGYEPSAHNRMGAVKTAYGTTWFAPPLRRVYALKDTGNAYEVNTEGIQRALFKYARQGLPVRFVGFPAYMYFLVRALDENNIRLKLNGHSKVLLGGGWKQFSSEEIDREAFFGLILRTLGIDRSRCLEFYSAVEHPIPYCKCKNGHFHVPVYSRAIVRDVHNLMPVPNGEVGLLSFVTPLVLSMPLVSVVTDDLSILHDGWECGCGIQTPYFELLGRAGAAGIKTCAAGAAELLKGAKP
jgi:phenylacetate-coenzyme A ligase PaaK-like adenylate-forming protein